MLLKNRVPIGDFDPNDSFDSMVKLINLKKISSNNEFFQMECPFEKRFLISALLLQKSDQLPHTGL